MTPIDLAGLNIAGMMQAQSPMESTQGVDFTGENRSRAAVAQLVERSFRKAYVLGSSPSGGFNRIIKCKGYFILWRAIIR